MKSNLQPARPLKQLVYTSSAIASFDPLELEHLLERSRHRNQMAAITGVLLYRDSTFFQVLEGPVDAVDALFQRIESDPRHAKTVVLSSQKIKSRNFGDWPMGFAHQPNVIEQLPGFVDFFARTDPTEFTASESHPEPRFTDLRKNSQRMRQILEGFRRGRWQRSEFQERHLASLSSAS
ncbi:Blue light- and temperature-regulated antirepressor YcgF [Rubripirellula tenax]|uniref:Blue light-and temperature-regulated antirepressor YcgF n=1 Tax=Rubripirellula tenax TaxID=2528015 RepID=A0A5C6FGM1_9BACT|nr:BLUF domain-containing protein [Rubripirellula tenax]TWU59990.1 Blue light- and temperature-regulated antirepressor YcgF [Rubripirellula tenax]